jgi:hypothetical protein
MMEVPMLLELAVTVFVATYIIIIVIGGHVLLIVALLRYLREGGPQGGMIVRAMPQSEMKPEMRPLPVRSTKGSTSQDDDLDIGHCQLLAPRESILLNFDEQRRALGSDLRYVVTLTTSHC